MNQSQCTGSWLIPCEQSLRFSCQNFPICSILLTNKGFFSFPSEFEKRLQIHKTHFFVHYPILWLAADVDFLGLSNQALRWKTRPKNRYAAATETNLNVFFLQYSHYEVFFLIKFVLFSRTPEMRFIGFEIAICQTPSMECISEW